MLLPVHSITVRL
jgi:hypothetical protein